MERHYVGQDFSVVDTYPAGELVIPDLGLEHHILYASGIGHVNTKGDVAYCSLELRDYWAEPKDWKPMRSIPEVPNGLLSDIAKQGKEIALSLQDADIRSKIEMFLPGKPAFLFLSRTDPVTELLTAPHLQYLRAQSRPGLISVLYDLFPEGPFSPGIPTVSEVYEIHRTALEGDECLFDRSILIDSLRTRVPKMNEIYAADFNETIDRMVERVQLASDAIGQFFGQLMQAFDPSDDQEDTDVKPPAPGEGSREQTDSPRSRRGRDFTRPD